MYDVKYSGRVGRSVNNLLSIDNIGDFTIKNISNIDWNEFDTIIIGHIKDLLAIGNCYEMINRILVEAVNREKSIYSFGNIYDFFSILNSSKANVYIPLLKNNNIKKYLTESYFALINPF